MLWFWMEREEGLPLVLMAEVRLSSVGHVMGRSLMVAHVHLLAGFVYLHLGVVVLEELIDYLLLLLH
jgi:hypothetical protein